MDRGSQLDEEDEEDEDDKDDEEDEEDEEEEEDEEDEDEDARKRKRKRKRKATNIKSNNPHLAGGEKSGLCFFLGGIVWDCIGHTSCNGPDKLIDQCWRIFSTRTESHHYP